MDLVLSVPVPLGGQCYYIYKVEKKLKAKKCTNCNGHGEIYIEETDNWKQCNKCYGCGELENYKDIYDVYNKPVYANLYYIQTRVNDTPVTWVELFTEDGAYVAETDVLNVFSTFEEAQQKADELNAYND